LQENLAKGSGPDFDSLFAITQSTELGRDQNFNHGLGSSKTPHNRPIRVNLPPRPDLRPTVLQIPGGWA